MVDTTLITRVKKLSPADRLELIEAVWETFSSAETPVTEAEKTLLDARLEDEKSNPADQASWSEVQERLKSRLS